MKIQHILIQGLLLALVITNAQSVICNGRSRTANCENPNFQDEYRELFCSRYYLIDGIEASRQFIERTAIREKFILSLNGETEKFTAAVKSLIELHRIIEKFNTTDNQLELVQELTTAVAEDSCKWLNEVGVISSDCNSSDSYLPQLEELAARLEVLEAIYNSKEGIRSIPNVASFTSRVHYCAWYNNKILDNCRNETNYNSAYREAFQPLCSGGCIGPVPNNNTTLCSI